MQSTIRFSPEFDSGSTDFIRGLYHPVQDDNVQYLWYYFVSMLNSSKKRHVTKDDTMCDSVFAMGDYTRALERFLGLSKREAINIPDINSLIEGRMSLEDFLFQRIVAYDEQKISWPGGKPVVSLIDRVRFSDDAIYMLLFYHFRDGQSAGRLLDIFVDRLNTDLADLESEENVCKFFTGKGLTAEFSPKWKTLSSHFGYTLPVAEKNKHCLEVSEARRSSYF
jgi:hypothetical protein